MRRSLILLSILSLGLAACSHETGGSAGPATRPAETVEAQAQPTRLEAVDRGVDAPAGTLFGDEEAVISAKVAGRVTRLFADLGDRTAAGAPLAEIDPTDYQLLRTQREMALAESLAKLGFDALPPGSGSGSGGGGGGGAGEGVDLSGVPTVERTRLQAANAEARFNRGKQLFETQPPRISEQEYQDLQTAFAVARSDAEVALLEARSLLAEARSRRSELGQATQQLADTVVRATAAPVAASGRGRGAATGPAGSRPAAAPAASAAAADRPGERPRYAVAARLVSIGEYVREGTPMFRVVADDPIKFRANLPERYRAGIAVGQELRMNVEAFPDRFVGRVTRISPQVDATSRTFQIEALVPNSDGRLQPGAFARGWVVTGVEPAAVFAPQAAVVVFAGVKKVFVVQDGKAKEVPVETGMTRGGFVEITKGLKGVQPLAVSNTGKLSTGTPVAVREEESEKKG